MKIDYHLESECATSNFKVLYFYSPRYDESLGKVIMDIYCGHIIDNDLSDFEENICKVIKELDALPLTVKHNGRDENTVSMCTKFGWIECKYDNDLTIKKLEITR